MYHKPNFVEDSYLSGHAITRVLKRHSPILPTAGRAKLSALHSFSDAGLNINPASRLFRRTLNFVTACGRQNWRTALHWGKDFAVSTKP